MERTDVAVVGGGPAGAAAAISLARQGREVVLVDKATFPRDKICGDGLTAGALRLLDELGLDPRSVPSWQPVDDVVVRSPSGHEVRFPLPRGKGLYGVVARRAELDAALLDVARSAGVKVHDGHACTGAEEHPDRVVLEVEGIGHLSARYAIGADGMWSPLRKHLGVATPGYRGEWHAFRQYFTAVGPEPAPSSSCGSSPTCCRATPGRSRSPAARANVGFGIQRDGGKVARVQDMKALWPDLLARPHIAAVLGPDADPSRRTAPGPSRPGSTTWCWPPGAPCSSATRPRRRDPMTGEGIGQALLTGLLAGRGDPRRRPRRPRVVRSLYERRVPRRARRRPQLSLLLVRALRHRKGARTAVRVAGATAGRGATSPAGSSRTTHAPLVTTPRRWHRGMFTGPGAYR